MHCLYVNSLSMRIIFHIALHKRFAKIGHRSYERTYSGAAIFVSLITKGWLVLSMDATSPKHITRM